MIKLATPLVEKLLTQPESGMGYQRVEVTTTRSERKIGIAYNAELVLLESEARDGMTRSMYESLAKSARSSFGEIADIRVLFQPAGRSLVMEKSASGSSGPAKDAPIETTKASEVFKRFSAYPNDRRVASDKSLLPGTYATTEADARNVRTGTEAVARYALANPEPASNVFTSKPHAGTQVQRGKVAPANNQPGGGAEVIVPNGTQLLTTTGPVKIPD
jgi:hypothetical protein